MSVHSRHSQPVVDQRRFFDELITEEWASYASEEWDYTRRFEVSRILRRIRPSHVLDIGCGCGFHDVEFARHEFVERVDGIDYSTASVAKANEAYPHSKVQRRVADFNAETGDHTYDLVVSFQVIEHLPDPRRYFQFAIEACRPGGVIAVVTPNANRLDNRLRRLHGEPPLMLDPQHFCEYSIDSLTRAGEAHGLRRVDAFGHGLRSVLYPRWTAWHYRRSTAWGAAAPRLANIIGVLFEVPPQHR